MVGTSLRVRVAGPDPAPRAERRRVELARRTERYIDRARLVPTALLTLAAVVIPLLYHSAWDDAFNVIKLGALWSVLGATLVLVFVLIVALGSVELRWGGHRVVNTALGVWIGWNLLAFALSTDRSQSLVGEHYWYQGLLTILLYAAFFMLGRVVLTRATWLWILAAGIVAGGVTVSVVAWMQMFGSDPVFGIDPPGGRAFATIGQPNALGAYLVTTIVIATAFLGRPERAVRAFGAAAMLVMAGALVLTESRGAFAGLFVAAVVGVVGLVWTSGASWKRVGAACLVVLVALALLVGTVGTVRHRVEAAWDRTVGGTANTIDPSNRIHTVLWHEAWRISLDHPLVGTGQETFPDIVPPYLSDQSQQVRFGLVPFRLESPHNLFLAITTGAGLPALAAYLALILSVLGSVLRGARRAVDSSTRGLLVAIVAVVAGHLVTGAFMTADLTTTWLTWLLMGGALAVVGSPEVLDTPTRTPTRRSDRSAVIEPGPWDLLPERRVRRARPPRARWSTSAAR